MRVWILCVPTLFPAEITSWVKAGGRLFWLVLRLSAKIHGSMQLSEPLIGGGLYQSHDQNWADMEGLKAAALSKCLVPQSHQLGNCWVKISVCFCVHTYTRCSRGETQLKTSCALFLCKPSSIPHPLLSCLTPSFLFHHPPPQTPCCSVSCL